MALYTPDDNWTDQEKRTWEVLTKPAKTAGIGKMFINCKKNV